MAKPKVDSQFLAILINNIVVPEIVNLIKAHHAQTGQLLTADEIKAKLNVDADAVIAQGQQYLDTHPAEAKALAKPAAPK